MDEGGTLLEKLDRLALDIGKVGFFVAGIVFVVMCIEWAVVDFADNSFCKNFDSNSTLCEFSRPIGCELQIDNFTCR